MWNSTVSSGLSAIGTCLTALKYLGLSGAFSAGIVVLLSAQLSEAVVDVGQVMHEALARLLAEVGRVLGHQVADARALVLEQRPVPSHELGHAAAVALHHTPERVIRESGFWIWSIDICASIMRSVITRKQLAACERSTFRLMNASPMRRLCAPSAACGWSGVSTTVASSSVGRTARRTPAAASWARTYSAAFRGCRRCPA